MNPSLIILAAGLGSRYGSLKQIDRVGPSGERIIDYSVYDAVRAGFKKIIFVIRSSFQDEFISEVLNTLPRYIEMDYVCQEIHCVPESISYNSERIKPWGTGHAVLTAGEKLNEPFAVINADDFYGPQAFKVAAQYLSRKEVKEYAAVGYQLKNTLSGNGSVSRGLCAVRDNYITSIREVKRISQKNGRISDENVVDNQHSFSGEELVSMNFFLFTPDLFTYLKKYFIDFIKEHNTDLKTEFELPGVINQIIQSGEKKLRALDSADEWFGLTYKEDKILARKRITTLILNKTYPENLWK